MSRLLAIGALAVTVAACGGTGSPAGAGGGTSETLAVGAVAPVTVPPGGSAELSVPVIVADGYHVQANPAADELLIPLELQLDAGDLAVEEIVYPPGHTYRLQGATEDLLTYEGTVAVTVRLAAPADATPGQRKLTGSVRYQACDERRCFAPTTAPLTATVIVEE